MQDQYTFIDWRPVPVPPSNRALLGGGIMPVSEILECQPEYKNRKDLIEKAIFYIANDGFIILKIKFAVKFDTTSALFLAMDIMHCIKKKYKHAHIANSNKLHGKHKKIFSMPVLTKNIEDEALEHTITNIGRLKNLKSVSRKTGDVSHEFALLTLKKLYASVFDIVSGVVRVNDIGRIISRENLLQIYEKYIIIYLIIWTSIMAASYYIFGVYILVVIFLLFIFVSSYLYFNKGVMRSIYNNIIPLRIGCIYMLHGDTLSNMINDIYKEISLYDYKGTFINGYNILQEWIKRYESIIEAIRNNQIILYTVSTLMVCIVTLFVTLKS